MTAVSLDQALKNVLDHLVRRDLTAHEVRQIAGRQGADEYANEIVARLESWGFLDDSRLAAQLGERSQSKLLGRERIAADLERRGVPADLAEEILAQVEMAEPALARRALERKFKPTDSPAKAARHLAGRGFSEETIRDLIESYFEEGGA